MDKKQIEVKQQEIAAKLAAGQPIIFSDGVFAIDDTDIAVTRGGGVFELAKEYRAIEHDGARGEYVKGMISLDRATPKLAMNTLSILADADFSKMYSNIKAVKTGSTTKITGDFKIKDTDFHTVTWTGFLDDGTPVKITVENAINLENINWSLVEKNEIVHALNYVGTYSKGSKDQPWSIEIGAA